MSVRGNKILSISLCAWVVGCAATAHGEIARVQASWTEWRRAARPLDLEIRGQIAELRQKLVDNKNVVTTPDLRRRLRAWDDTFTSLKMTTELLFRDIDVRNPLELQIGDEVLLKYFRILAQRLQVERALTANPLSAWAWNWEGIRLTLPATLMPGLPSLQSVLPDRWNGGESRFLETRVGGAYFEVTFSEAYLEGLEWASAVDRVAEPSYFEATRRLLQTHLQGLSERVRLLRSRADDTTALPRGVRSGAWRRDILAAYLSAELPRLVSREFSFLDEPYLASIARLLADDYGMKEPPPKLVPTLRTSLREAEARGVEAYVMSRYREATVPFESLSPVEQRRQVAQWISEAYANAHLRYFLDAIVSDAIQLSETRRMALVKIVERRRVDMAQKIEVSPHVGAFLAQAEARSAQGWLRKEQAQLTQSLRAAAIELLSIEDKAQLDAKPVDFMVAARALAPRLRAQGASPEVLAWLDDVTTEATDWASARRVYMAQLGARTDPSLIQEGKRVSDTAVLLFLANHDFAQGVWAPPSLSTSEAKEYRRRIADERRVNLRTFVRAGQSLRFFSAFSDDKTPRVRDLFASKDVPEYREALKQSLLNSHPLLGIPLGSDRLTLAQKLVDVGGNAGAAWELIATALATSQSRVDSALISLKQARGVQDIESLLTDSLFLALSLEYYPELGKTAVKTVERLRDPTVIDRIMERHVGGYLMSGFGSLLVAHGTAWLFKGTAPYIQTALGAMAPQIRAYVWSATGLVVADTIHQAENLHRSGESARWAEDMFYASPESSYFFEESDVRHLRSSYEFSRWLFAGRIVLDSLFLYVPVSREVWAFHGLRREIGAFRTLGLKAGQWEELDSAFSQARARLGAGSANPSPRLRQAEEAYKFLRARLLSGAGGEARRVLSESADELAKVLNGEAA